MRALFGIVLALATFGGAHLAQAHPHVWAQVRSVVVYKDGQVAGLRHEWRFDENFTESIKEEFDKNGDGKLAKSELDELVKLNMAALEDFDFFTIVRSEGKKLAFGKPFDFSMEHVDKQIVLRFTVALKTALRAGQAFAFTVEDPTFYTSMQFVQEADSVALGTGAPAGCRISLGDRNPATAEERALVEAFSDGITGGVAMAGNQKMAHVSCG
ncbi:MAG: hypothetical protein RLZ98_2799 [Pseudomonadota bacterium]|jgi:ABC-type uncharacterized transport system substrate-binding protein